MKKLLVLIAMLGTYMSSYAFLTQNSWRWRNNDGSETTATWKAPQNTAITYNSIDEVIRLRLEIFNNNTGDPIQIEDSLQYTTTPLDNNSWINVTSDNSHAFIIAGATSAVTQDDPTTSQLTGLAFPFSAGKMMVTEDVAKNIFVESKDRTEVEWVIKGTPSTASNTIYYFKHWGSTSNELTPGVSFPSLTTGGTLPVKIQNFTAVDQGKFVRLDWTTSSEQDNDRFEVQRSINRTEWATIASVKGNGTQTAASKYTAYDNKPFSGENYYRLKQIDNNGKYAISSIKLVNLSGYGDVSLEVYPNPSNASVSFAFRSKTATDVVAVLTDASGKVLHQEKFKSIGLGTINKLSLKQRPAAGLYYLNIYAHGVSRSVKVLLQ